MIVRLLAVVLTLAACAAPQTPADPPQGEQEGAREGVPEALDWTGTLLAGGQLDGADLAGGDVVLWFWAPW